MLRRFSATPCPLKEDQTQANRRDSLYSASGDTTTSLDFTTSFKASFRDVKPRRRPTTATAARRGGLEFAIHEDEELQLNSQRQDGPEDTLNIRKPARRTSLVQAPIKPSQRVSFLQTDGASDCGPQLAKGPTNFSRPPRRGSINPNHSINISIHDDTLPAIQSPKISKPARRGTIYIPNDDTTIASVHMGIFSPIKYQDRSARCQEQGNVEDLTGIAAQMAMKKSARRSTLTTSPRRGVLQASIKSTQLNSILEDKVGQGSGKENFPPGHVLPANKKYAEKRKARWSVFGTAGGSHAVTDGSARTRPPSNLFAPTASSMAREKPCSDHLQPRARPAWNSGAVKSTSQQPPSKAIVAPKQQSPKQEILEICKPRVPTRFVVPCIPTKLIDQDFPLLPEGLPHVSLYEDNWLSQQEVALTQLIDNVFAASRPEIGIPTDQELLRLRVAQIYGNDNIVLIHKRLQGALLFGTLSISYDGLARGLKIYDDLGSRKMFTDLWLDTYSHDLLKAALEVVVGRVMPVTREHKSSERPSSSDGPRFRKAIRGFIETFLLRNEDSPSDDENASGHRPFQRTVLRSLMLVKLLDMIGVDQTLPKPANLFQKTSTYKTSYSVLLALMQMLNTSVGDPTRSLNHLGYMLEHFQYPLEEYDYTISNLAIDFRDGVRLTRLVEILLYRSASRNIDSVRDADATTTLCMPTGEVLSLTESESDWPLSQHLKIPCQSRAVKVFNVQVALSALKEVKGMDILIQNITAEDIVDGFREKTVKLLWGLTSKWGLGGLVDWTDVRSEIRRLARARDARWDGYFDDFDIDEDEPSYVRHKALLKAWARAVADSHGIKIRNFNTSFSDGKAFKAIVDEYQPHLTAQATGQEAEQSLHDRLRNLGCSNEFAQLFAANSCSLHKQHIFDKDFVLASLAFLCSRLLGPSKRVRAAIAIQRAWRKRWQVVLDQRKVVLRHIADACADQVQTRWRKEAAKNVIWRAWLQYRSKKSVDNLQNHSSLSPQDAKDSRVEDDIWLSL